MKNQDIAKIFSGIADILEIQGANPFRIRAYRKAAQNVEALSEDVELRVKAGNLEQLPGIGKDLADKITELISTGTLKFYEGLKKEIPDGMVQLLQIPEVGPKTIKTLHAALGISAVDDLEKACLKHKIQQLPHFKAKTEENILRGIKIFRTAGARILLKDGLDLVDPIIERLKKLPAVRKISAAGSLRRRKETVGDLDVLATGKDSGPIMEAFTTLPNVKEILAKGETKSSVLLKEGRQVDLRVVRENSFGAALQYFTGSKPHNIHLRTIAGKKGWKINEYGLWDKKNKSLAGKVEPDVYKKLGLQFVPPELREDMGEVEAALKNQLPELVDISNIKGDLHIHSNYSDGGNTIEEIVKKARQLGYQYIAITDHSQSLKVAGGLSREKLKKRNQYIKKLNQSLQPFRILIGMEVDIDSNGNLDYPDEILKELDFVIAAVHTGFKQSKEQITSRIVNAMHNKYVQALAHPTSRLIGERPPYQVDLDKVIDEAAKTHTFIEINAYPKRLDLPDIYCRQAKKKGVKFYIATDAHITDQLGYLELGVFVARRGWLEEEDIINTYPLEQLLKLLKRK